VKLLVNKEDTGSEHPLRRAGGPPRQDQRPFDRRAAQPWSPALREESWTVAHHPFHPGFKAELPYVLATVDLEEGVRMIAQLRGVAPDAGTAGLPVEVAFERATDDLTLPVFRSVR
jgi:hypothetical protein